MSVLASLVQAYERLADRHEVPPFGYSSEKIGFLIPLHEDGTPGMPIDLREGEGRRLTAPLMAVPASFKRPGMTPRAFFLWDNTAFALGVTASESKDAATRFAAFRKRHLDELSSSDDPGLVALLRFIEKWQPETFTALGWPEAMKDQNIVFALESERLRNIRIHDRPAARALWSRLAAKGERSEAICLITGERSPVARLHPAIKGVWGAQSSGASMVSFNLDAFTSYGHEQGDNAPVSEAAAFAYTTALNKFLETGSRNRLQIGDASTVFWADASNARLAEAAEDAFAAFFGEQRVDEAQQAAKIGTVLEKIRAGRPLTEIDPGFADGVRFHVLGLSPNAARLSVRFWLDDDFGEIARRYARHAEAMRIEPPPKDQSPSIWRCLIETAALRKTDNIQPNLAGEWLRAILTGTAYPLSLLSTVLMRLKADHDVNALRAAMLKAVLISRNKEAPVSLDPQNKDPGYLLGRLFATFEYAQVQALGGKVNATIRDQYYGTASATPRSVFPVLQRKTTHHLSRLRKDKPGMALNLDRKMGEIFELADADALFVPTLSATRQALFAIGYYHQKNDFYRRRDSRRRTSRPRHRGERRMTALANRYDFVFLFDVANGNPNGDPDAGNLPRLDPETNQGLVTDVCLKRKIRNYAELAKDGDAGYGIYVKESAILNEQHRKAYAAIRPDKEKVAKEKKLNPANDAEAIELRQFMCDNFFDVRTFGAVMSTGINCGQVRGPVQFSFARSIEPIVPLEISITRMAATTADEKLKRDGTVDEDSRTENRTMGRKHIVPYGLYRAHGFVSAKLAERTGFTEGDLGFLWEALGNMFEHDRSAARGEMAARKLIVFKHGSALGNAQASALFDRVTVGRSVDGEIRLPGDPRLDNMPPARRYGDYGVAIDRVGLPESVEILELL